MSASCSVDELPSDGWITFCLYQVYNKKAKWRVIMWEEQVSPKVSTREEVEWAWAWAWRLVSNLGLAVNKAQAHGSVKLFFGIARGRLELGFKWKAWARGYFSQTWAWLRLVQTGSFHLYSGATANEAVQTLLRANEISINNLLCQTLSPESTGNSN